jgi:translation initiation factor IF-3
VREIRVIDDTGEQLGIMPPQQALALAKTKNLDLVEVAATATPPVCRIMDFGKYQYQEQKRQREARKHQKVTEVKEIKFRPKVDEHDYLFKKKHIQRFLADGDKVKATIFFRGREMAHPEIGRRILERLLDELVAEAIAENMPRKEGNTMHVILARKPGWKPPKAAPKPAAAPGAAGTAAAAAAVEPEPAEELEPLDELEPFDEDEATDGEATEDEATEDETAEGADEDGNEEPGA